MSDLNKPKPIRFDVAPDLHHRLKIAAAEERLTMHEFIRMAIVAAIEDRSIVRSSASREDDDA